MADQLEDLVLGGTSVALDTDTYFTFLTVGAKRDGNASYATSAGEAYFYNDVEIRSSVNLWCSQIAAVGSAIFGCPNGDASGMQLGYWTGSGAVTSYITLDTNDTQIEAKKTLEISTDGIVNLGGGTGTIKQEERAVYDLAALDAAGGILNQENPWGEAGYVSIEVDVTTQATGACTADFGVAATGVSDDGLIDGADVGTAAVLLNCIDDKGGNGAAWKAIAAGEFITGSMATGAAAGLVGKAYITFRKKG